LATHMRALHDRSLRARLGTNARNAVLPLTSAAMMAQLLALYRDLLDPEAVAHPHRPAGGRSEAIG